MKPIKKLKSFFLGMIAANNHESLTESERKKALPLLFDYTKGGIVCGGGKPSKKLIKRMHLR